MIRTTVEFPLGFVEEYRRYSEQRLGQAMLKAADVASKGAKADIRDAMSGAGLGRLGQAIGQESDLSKGLGVHSLPNGGFSASGMMMVRGSQRSHGAVEAYTEGADIRPIKSQWLWIATDAIPKRAGRYRMTPALYNSSGLAARIGPLVMVRRSNGYPMLVVKGVGVLAASGRGARRLPKRGGVRAGRVEASIVAFIGIPYTSRLSRVDVPSIVRARAETVGALVNAELQKGA